MSVAAFSEQIIESGFISADDLRALLDGLPDEQKSDAEQLARELVRQRKLTAYQAQEIFKGRGQHLVLGNYVVLDKLGQGGMGMVLKAEHRRMQRQVAIKVLSPNAVQSLEAIKRFHREVQAAAKMEHPNIVTAHDADEAGGTHFLVMQYVDGADLSALVKRNGPLPVDKALHCVLQAARGLEYAHGRGIVHRDIKPANLLLDRDGTVKILDMGLARLDSAGPNQDELTGTGQIMGTIDYMAPEQALSTKSADRRADIYSLGITLWYLLTGKPAYTGDSTMAKLLAHRERAIPSLRAACPAAPPALDAVFARMVAKTPEARYQTMTEAIADLERCRTGQEVKAPSVSAAPGEDTRLNEFLRGLEESAAGRAVTGKGAKAAVVSWKTAPAVIEETLANTLPAGDTDPTTEQLLRAPDLPAARPAWLRRLPSAPRRRNLALVVATAALLVAGIAGLWWANRPTVRVADGDSLLASPPQADQRPDADPARQANDQSSDSPAYTWPADAPPPAIAPFDAAQARAHQEAWAAHLGVPVEYTNSIGMKFVLIPPGEFLMGSTPDEIEEALVVAGADEHWKNCIRSEAPRHKVILTQALYLGVDEVTQAEYEQVMGQNPSHFAATGAGKEAVVGLDTGTYPVEQVSWTDAYEFCTKLSEKEQLQPFKFELRAGETVMTPGTGYRLPTEAEWEFACRGGTTTKYWTGDQDESLVQAGWFKSNSGGRTHAVGELKANPFGLFDIHGNVWEWVQDWWEANYYAQFQEKPALDPSGPSSAGYPRVIRGGRWHYFASYCRASTRYASAPAPRLYYVGFRVALAVDAVQSIVQKEAIAAAWAAALPADAPPPAIAPFDAAQARAHQEAWAAHLGVPVEYENTIGMKFVLIPPGEFMMGSMPEEIEAALVGADEGWKGFIRSEAPRHKVLLTRPIYLGVHEVTQSQYEQVMAQNPSHFAATGPGKDAVAGMDTTSHPVEMVSWNDAAEFCTRLSEQEQLQPFKWELRRGETVRIEGTGYRLPTEAEWEFACRAGTTTRFWCGEADQDLIQAGWFGSNSGGRTHRVEELKANPFGLYDIHGNVVEWVQDWWEPTYYSQFQEKPALDPSAPSSDGSRRVIRGGFWSSDPSSCRSSSRLALVPFDRTVNFGFRVALAASAARGGR